MFTHIRSSFNDNIVSPRFLDVGFFVAFGILTLACVVDSYMSHVIYVWCNVFLMGSASILFVLGYQWNYPFIIPYAIEAGLPKQAAEDPFFVYLMGKASMKWAWLFIYCTLVSAVAPSYRCFIDGGEDGSYCYAEKSSTYDSLNSIFSGYGQTAIFIWMIYKGVWLDGQKRGEQERWSMRDEDEIRMAHGVPLESCTVSGKQVLTMPSIPPLSSGDSPAPEVEERIARAVQVCARAFLDDPLFMKWPKVGSILDRGRRLEAMLPIFDIMVRAAMMLNHCFVVEERSFCLCVPSWPRGDESEFFLSGPMMGAMVQGAPISFPPVEVLTAASSIPRLLFLLVQFPFLLFRFPFLFLGGQASGGNPCCSQRKAPSVHICFRYGS